MENSKKQAIALEVQKYIDTYGLTQTDIAQKSSVRKEYLTAILKGKFTYDAGNGKTGAIPVKYFYQLAQLIGFTTDKVYWINRPTEQLTTTLAILQEAKNFGDTRLIIGATGSGKSNAIQLFTRRNPADVYVVTVGSSDNLGDLIDKIIDVLNITTGKTKSKKLRDIAKKLKELRDDGKTPQLIFDEAEYMKQPALCSMKELHDYLNKFCSIILIGTKQLLDNLDKLRKRNKNGIPQFYRRVKFGIRVLPSIDTSFKLFLNEIEDKEVVKFLRAECENYGELHDVLVPCMREVDRINQPLTLNLVKQVLNIQDVA
ncbi:ATP-binding protein [Tenacibaculum maritimum]|nr:ATP-binding protein [Tenacibaculum maritimum]MDB0603152.1 ATP-binding protein [Tenacibaculum maritimum]MDB0610416.1 ATP-binding protein [Tenacibaculum maritimum]